MKNSFLVSNKEIDFRRASLDDNLEEIAELIYKTDPYIYPFWFNNDIEKAKKYLPKLMKQNGNLFNINNFYVAIDMSNNHIIGILCAIDKSVNLNYSFKNDKLINNEYRFTIENYILGLHEEVKEFDDKTIYISNICVQEGYRGKKIGSYLIGYFLWQMERNGFDTFALDCLLHNLRAKNLYHGMGFKEMKEIVGFDGTNNSKVEVVSFLRKKGNYYPREFQVSMMDR